jgi:hypothetical protein
MVIKFLCPNGHQLSAPENMAGKKGKCPKCQSAFVVPTMAEVAAAGAEPAGDEQVEAAGPAPASAAASDVAAASGSGKGPPAGEMFVFLCPNGHKLNGPPSLKGKAGQCPHCGAKFRIPTDDEEEESPEEQSDGQQPMQVVVGASDSGSGGFRFPFEQFAPEEPAEATVEEPLAAPPAGAPGMGYIFARLWERRGDQSEVEIFLSEGEIVAPDHFSEMLSGSDYGVFAIQEGDGTYAVTVIPWNAVRRVGVRKLGELPENLFS